MSVSNGIRREKVVKMHFLNKKKLLIYDFTDIDLASRKLLIM